MPEDFLTRREHEEFTRRMSAENDRLADENNRQNKRLEALEGNMESLHSLTVSVGKLANHMEHMDKEQERQGKRLEMLESKPAKRWDGLVDKVILTLVAALVGFALARLGVMG